MTANLLTLNSSKTELLLIGLKQQLSKIHDSSLTTTHSAPNLGFPLCLINTLPSPIKSLHFLNPAFQLRCILPYIDSKTASTNATSTVHSKLNSLYHNLPNYQRNRFKLFCSCFVKAYTSSHITPILKSLQWLKVNERIEYKLLSLTYKVLTTSQPSYVNYLISFQSLAVYPLLSCCHPFSPTNHLIENHRSLMQICTTRLWNQLPDSFRQSCLDLPPRSFVSPSLSSSPLSLSITLSLQAHNLPFQQTLFILILLLPLSCLHDHMTGPDLSCSSIYF